MGKDLVRMSNGDIADQTVSFFKRREKWVGVGGMALMALIATGLIAHFHVFAILANVAWEGLNLLWGGAALLASALLLSSKKTWLMGQLICWHFYNRFIDKLDPAERAQFAMKEQQKIIDQLDEKAAVVTGFVERLTESIGENEEKITEAEETIREASKPENASDRNYLLALQEASDNYNLLFGQNREYADTLKVFQQMDTSIAENIAYAKFTQRKTKNRRDLITQRRRTMQGARSAAEDIRALLFNGEFKEFGTKAEQQMLDEINRDMGYFKNFVRETEPLTAQMDIQKKINVQKALDRINGVENRNKSLLMEYKQKATEEGVWVPTTVEQPRLPVSAVRSRFE